MMAAGPSRANPLDARPYVVPRFLPLEALDPNHRKADQIGRCVPSLPSAGLTSLGSIFGQFRSPKSPSQMRAPCCAKASAMARFKSGYKGFATPWLPSFQLPTSMCPTPSDLGSRRLRGNGVRSWRMLLAQEDSKVSWIRSVLPMFPQLPTLLHTQHQLGGYLQWHPGLVEFSWKGENSCKLLLQLKDITDPTGIRAVTVFYRRREGSLLRSTLQSQNLALRSI
jgi:hypothetical protein